MSVLLMAASTATLSKVPFLKQKRILIPTTTILLAILAIFWWLASPLFLNVVVNEPFPFDASSNSDIVANSQFVDHSFIHRGSGNAMILQLEDELVLRLEDFHVTNGPDLQVLLVEDIEGTNSTTFGDYLDLGPLTGNIGNQNYAIPSGIDLSKYAGIVIYCEPFHVVFSTASFGS